MTLKKNAPASSISTGSVWQATASRYKHPLGRVRYYKVEFGDCTTYRMGRRKASNGYMALNVHYTNGNVLPSTLRRVSYKELLNSDVNEFSLL
jgi:hypothetical protein